MSLSEYITILNSSNDDDIIKTLKTIELNYTCFSINDKAKLIDILLTRVDENKWTEECTSFAIQILKLLGRTTQGSEALFSEKGITILKKVAGLEKENTFKDISSTHEALKCLANCILLEEKTKIYVEKNNGVLLCGQILEKNKELSLDSEFLICRIIFFMTVNRSDIVQQLMDYNIADSTERILSNNVDIILKEKDNLDISKPINPVSVVNEALKMLFNMILAYERRPQQQEQSQKNEQSSSFITTELTGPEYFNLCLLPIFKIIFQVPPPEPLPLSPPHSHAIHALMQYPYSVVVQIWRDHKDKVFQPNTSVEEGRAFVGIKMIELLQKSFDYLLPNEDPDDIPQENRQHYNIDAILSPIILVIRNLAHGDVNLRPLIAKILLPQEKDRMLPVNKGKSLSAYLIRLMTSAMLPQTRDAVCETLFALCDEDASLFSQKVGYGNAIGYLVNRGIAIEPPEGYNNDDKNNKDKDKEINPITGQYRSAERDEGPSLADMTDEEKEREAEKLFVLFERLKKTGIIDVENPIAKAMRENTYPDKVQSSDDDDDENED